MKSKTILSVFLAAAFILVLGSLSWADSYRSEHHHYYYGDKYRHRYDHKPPKHYKKHSPKHYPRYYEHYRPYRRDMHIRNKHWYPYKGYPPPVYIHKYPRYYYPYRPYPPVYSGSGFFFGTSIFDPGLSVGFSITGR